MNNYYWEMMFPNVSFRDKIHIEYSDGTSEVIKHLYLNSFILKEIDWENVVELSAKLRLFGYRKSKRVKPRKRGV